MFNKCQYCSYCYGTNTRGNNCTNICTNRKQIHMTGNNFTTNLTTAVALKETKQLCRSNKGYFSKQSNQDSIKGQNHQMSFSSRPAGRSRDHCGFHLNFFFFFSIYIMQRHNMSWLQCSLNDRCLQGASIVQKYWFTHSLQI